MKELAESIDTSIDRIENINQLSKDNSNNSAQSMIADQRLVDKLRSLFSFINTSILVLYHYLRVKLLNLPMEDLTGMREASALEGRIGHVARDEAFAALLQSLSEQLKKGKNEVSELYP